MEVVDAVLGLTESVVAQSQVDRCQKLSIHIRKSLMQLMVLDGFAAEFGFSLPEELVVDTDTVVGECLSVTVVDAFTHL